MMFCPRCGATNDPGTRFCYNCGTRLDTTPEAAPAAPPTTQEPGGWGQPLPPPPQPMQSYGYAPVAPTTSTMATVSLVLGILGWVFPFLVLAIGAVICGHLARNEINRSGGQLGGSGLALAGLILGYLQIVLVALGACIIFGILVLAAVN